jgi:hypothetical protein
VSKSFFASFFSKKEGLSSCSLAHYAWSPLNTLLNITARIRARHVKSHQQAPHNWKRLGYRQVYAKAGRDIVK